MAEVKMRTFTIKKKDSTDREFVTVVYKPAKLEFAPSDPPKLKRQPKQIELVKCEVCGDYWCSRANHFWQDCNQQDCCCVRCGVCSKPEHLVGVAHIASASVHGGFNRQLICKGCVETLKFQECRACTDYSESDAKACSWSECRTSFSKTIRVVPKSDHEPLDETIRKEMATSARIPGWYATVLDHAFGQDSEQLDFISATKVVYDGRGVGIDHNLNAYGHTVHENWRQQFNELFDVECFTGSCSITRKPISLLVPICRMALVPVEQAREIKRICDAREPSAGEYLTRHHLEAGVWLLQELRGIGVLHSIALAVRDRFWKQVSKQGLGATAAWFCAVSQLNEGLKFIAAVDFML